MTVYIEYVIIDNFVLTYIIGLVSERSLKVKASRPRNLISSSLGTICAVFYPFLRINFYVIIILKVLLGLILSIILFYKRSRLPISSVAFFGITFLFGGIFFGLGYMIYGDVSKALTLPAFDFPIGIVLLACWILYLILKRMLIKFHKHRDVTQHIYQVKIEVMDKTFAVKGFHDSGNRLFDTKTGLPIAVASFNLCRKIFDSEALIKLLAGEGEKSYKDARYTTIKGYGGKAQKLWLLKPQKFLLYFEGDKNINIDIVLGLSTNNFSDAAEYGLIFGSSALGGMKH